MMATINSEGNWRRGHLNVCEAESPGKKLQIPNSKLQRSTRSQTPNTKLQTPEKLQAPSSKRGPRFGAWNLGFLWCLELGFWCFDSGIPLELGVWCLVFRSTAAQKLRRARLLRSVRPILAATLKLC